MSVPSAPPALLTDAPAADGLASSPAADTANFGATQGANVCHAWDDQDIDTAGTEADLWSPRSDGGS
jgi:hypothetical protein